MSSAPPGQFCPHCGGAHGPEDEFCVHCGTPLTAPAAAPPPAPVVPPAPVDTTQPVPVPPTPPGQPPPSYGAPPYGVPPPGVGGPAYGASPTGAGAPAYGTPPATGGLSNNAIIALIAVGVVVVSALAYVVLSGGSDGGDTAEDASTESIETSSTVPAPTLAAAVPITVSLDAGSTDDPRVHPLPLTAGQSGTVVVEGQGSFTPVAALLDPDGDEVPTQGVVLGDRGAAVAVTAADAGEYALLVSGFPEGLSGYTVTFRADETFVVPSQLAIGDCVDRLEGERWDSVSGFFVVDCGQPHEGQVFEQAPASTASGQAAQEQCDAARGRRIPVPGYVAWNAYWGDGLTCVVVDRRGGSLTGSIVSA